MTARNIVYQKSLVLKKISIGVSKVVTHSQNFQENGKFISSLGVTISEVQLFRILNGTPVIYNGHDNSIVVIYQNNNQVPKRILQNEFEFLLVLMNHMNLSN